ncbi:nucleotide exchange factor GrpE, partial [Siminovitchia fortis]|uniref:nucleotide exchange factor GrpE n=1 Tax=Siminovitchia fortis TaxID=254758 RepID=UPI00119F2BE4
EVEEEVEEKEKRYLRVVGDFDNLGGGRKVEREGDEKYRGQQLMRNVVRGIDKFERGMETERDNEETKGLLEGVGMVYRSMI